MAISEFSVNRDAMGMSAEAARDVLLGHYPACIVDKAERMIAFNLMMCWLWGVENPEELLDIHLRSMYRYAIRNNLIITPESESLGKESADTPDVVENRTVLKLSKSHFYQTSDNIIKIRLNIPPIFREDWGYVDEHGREFEDFVMRSGIISRENGTYISILFPKNINEYYLEKIDDFVTGSLYNGFPRINAVDRIGQIDRESYNTLQVERELINILQEDASETIDVRGDIFGAEPLLNIGATTLREEKSARLANLCDGYVRDRLLILPTFPPLDLAALRQPHTESFSIRAQSESFMGSIPTPAPEVL